MEAKRYLNNESKLIIAASAVLYILFCVGIFLFSIPGLVDFAQSTTAFMLLATSILCIAIALYPHYKLDKGLVRITIIWIVFVGIVTFVAEVLGANYGLVFGAYNYGEVLGPKLLAVPVIISLNWVMVTWGIFSFLERKIKNNFVFILVSALLAVGFDWIMEPVAIALGFWQWDGGSIPLSNYIGWFGLSVFAAALWKLLGQKGSLITHPVIVNLLLAQLIFFLALNTIKT